MSKLSVKVKTSTLIEALQKALDLREKRWANQEKEKAEYEKEVEAYNATIVKLVKSGKGKITEASESWSSRHERDKKKIKEFNVTVEIPKNLVPEQPKEVTEYRDYDYKNETQEISSSIRILKMTDQEYVSASTYKSVTQYL
jgi:hypothetical protein